MNRIIKILKNDIFVIIFDLIIFIIFFIWGIYLFKNDKKFTSIIMIIYSIAFLYQSIWYIKTIKNNNE